MAVNDIVSDSVLADFTFQPAASVQVVILQFFTTGPGARVLGQGNILSGNFQNSQGNGTSSTTLANWTGYINKFFIDNSSYCKFISGGDYVGFNGLQTQ